MSKNNGKWGPEICTKIPIPQPDGTNIFTCKCKTDLSPSSIIDDVAGLFENSKAAEIFSSKVKQLNIK